MNLLYKIINKKKIIQQAQDVLSGEYKHFQCDTCLNMNTFPRPELDSLNYCLAMKTPQHIWTPEEAEKMHNRWRDCKCFYSITDGGF